MRLNVYSQIPTRSKGSRASLERSFDRVCTTVNIESCDSSEQPLTALALVRRPSACACSHVNPAAIPSRISPWNYKAYKGLIVPVCLLARVRCPTHVCVSTTKRHRARSPCKYLFTGPCLQLAVLWDASGRKKRLLLVDLGMTFQVPWFRERLRTVQAVEFLYVAVHD